MLLGAGEKCGTLAMNGVAPDRHLRSGKFSQDKPKHDSERTVIWMRVGNRGNQEMSGRPVANNRGEALERGSTIALEQIR